MSVLLGNGNGTFQPQQTFAAGLVSRLRVAVADVNGDGKPDLVVANYGSDTVSVLLNNGNGTFTGPGLHHRPRDRSRVVQSIEPQRRRQARLTDANVVTSRSRSASLSPASTPATSRSPTTGTFGTPSPR